MIKAVWILLCFLCILPVTGIGQGVVVYSGKVTRVDDGQPVQGVSVLLKQREKIVSFGRTNTSGEFAIRSTLVDKDSLYVELNHLSYHRKRIEIVPNVFHYPIAMEEKIVALDEIKVGRRPAVQEVGDTLVYNVNRFTDSLDRSIGDVLKKMPGMEVKDDGRILYNGRGISDLYIDGDNLLGNRYGIGTKAIPHDAIMSVEVYRNHQKIKVLKDMVHSDDVALNLVVREDARMKLLGGGVVSGNGIQNYHLDANLMMFNKKIKTLNALMTNNTGYDVQYVLQDLVHIDVSSMDLYTLRSSLKSIEENNTPETYKNNSVGLSTNHHLNIGGWKIRANAILSSEKGKESIHSQLRYLTDEDSRTISEASAITSRPFAIASNWNFVKNTDNQYMDVGLDLSYRNRDIQDSLKAMDYLMLNTLNQDRLALKGSLYYIPQTKGRSLWDFRLSSNYRNSHEHLMVDSDDFIAAMLPYASLSHINQYLRRESVDINGRVNFRPSTMGSIRQYYVAEQYFQQEGLSSNMYEDVRDEDGTFSDFYNNVELQKIRSESSAGFNVDRGGLRADLVLPVGIQSLKTRAIKGELMDDRIDVLFQPTLTLRYTLSGYHGLKLDARRQQSYGNVNDIYSGAILINPRTVNSRAGFIPYYDLWRTSIEYSVQNPMNLLFAKIGYQYSFGNQNFLYQNDYNQEETIGIAVRKETNNVIRQEANMYISKFVDILRTTSSLKVNVKSAKNWMIVDDRLLTLRPLSVEFIPELNGKLGKRLEWQYRGSFIWHNNRIEAQSQIDKYYHFLQNMQATYRVSNQTYFTVGASHSALRNQYSSIDLVNMRASITYRLNRKIFERLEIAGSNLLNEKTDAFVIQSGNSFFRQESMLRARMILLRAMFNIN